MHGGDGERTSLAGDDAPARDHYPRTQGQYIKLFPLQASCAVVLLSRSPNRNYRKVHMASKIFSALVFCFAVAVLAGCDKDTPRRSPVGPTPIITPQEQARFSFDPVPPVAVSKNDTGYFRVNIEQGGVRTRLVAGVVSSNDHVLSLRLNGNRWRYTAVSGGAAEIRVMYAGKLRLSHGITVEDVRPVDSQFNDWFWRQLVFNQYDDPSRQWGNYTLDTTSPNVYIRMGDPTGRRVVSSQQRDHITRAVPQLAQQLTGSPYRGRIESGIEDRTRTGWITVPACHPGRRTGDFRWGVWPGQDRG